MFEFKKEYEIGVEEIDAEHRKFFEYINSAVHALDLPDEEAVEKARSILNVLLTYASTHFAHEEEYMKKVGSQELMHQSVEHGRFKEKISSMIRRQDELTKQDLGSIFIFMAKWLKGHILIDDKRIAHTSQRIVMTDDFLTGIDIIDEEHAMLFDLIARLMDIINNETMHDKFDSIVDVFNELSGYAVKHFADEERYMESISYDGLPAQRAAHEAFVDRVGEIDLQSLSDNEETQTEQLNDIVNFLADWLVSHILKMDKKIPVA